MRVQGQIEEAQLEALASAPGSPETARIYFDTALGLPRVYDGTSFINLGSAEFAGISNLGIKLDTGVLSLTQQDLTALTASGAAKILMPHSTAGRSLLLELTDALHHTEDETGTSDLTGMVWEPTANIAWATNRPLYVYLINSDNTSLGLVAALSFNPTASISPATTAEIGFNGTPSTNDADTDFFIMRDSITVANFTGKPCLRIGGVAVQKPDTDEEYVFQAISYTNKQGIRIDPHVGVSFVMPRGQNGAIADRHFLQANQPVWATQANERYNYSMGLDGWCDLSYDTLNAGDVTNGADAVDSEIAAPYVSAGLLGGTEFFQAGRYVVTGGANGLGIATAILVSGNKKFQVMGTDTAPLENNDFATGSDTIEIAFRYKAF